MKSRSRDGLAAKGLSRLIRWNNLFHLCLNIRIWIVFVKIQIWDRNVSHFNDCVFAETLCHFCSDPITLRWHPVFFFALVSSAYKALLLLPECFDCASEVNSRSLSINYDVLCVLWKPGMSKFRIPLHSKAYLAMLCKKCGWTTNKYFQLIETNFICFVITFHCARWASEKCCLDSVRGWQWLLLTWKKLLHSCQICNENYADLLLFNLCSLYKYCTSYICCIAAKFAAGYVNNSPKNLHTAFCLFVCFTLTPGLFPSWINGNNSC